MHRSPCSRARKWGTQRATTLLIFNFSHRIVWIDNSEISRGWASCRTVMWRSSWTTAATVFTISSVQMPVGRSTWGSSAVVSLPLEKALQQKIVKSPRHYLSVYTLCINFTVSAADFFNEQQNFITPLCSFFTSIFESLNLWGLRKTTFTKIAVTRQWTWITRWNFDHWCRIDYRSHCAA